MNINCSVYCPAAPQTYVPCKERALLQICDFWDRLKTSHNAPFCDMAMPIQVWNIQKSACDNTRILSEMALNTY